MVAMGCICLFRKNKRFLKDASSSTPSHALKMKQPMETSEASQSSERFCNICMDIKAPSEMFSNAKVCGHLFCSDCIRTYVSVKVGEYIAEITCPDPKCKGVIGPDICRFIVPKEVIEKWEVIKKWEDKVKKWEDALSESLNRVTQKFYCPFTDCSAMLVDDGVVTVTSSKCPNCHRLFCARCKGAWHPGMGCMEIKSLVGQKILEIKSLTEYESNPDKMFLELAKKKKWRRCPRCNFFVERRGGCNHITCRCGHGFCYTSQRYL